MSEIKNEDTGICKEKKFHDFFKKNATLLRNFLYYKYGALEDVDDIVQDSFIKLWDNCTKVTEKTAKSYLFRIAINQSNSLLRHEKVKLKHQKEVKNINLHSTNETPEYVLEEKEFMTKLENAISSLPERQREVFLLNRIEKKTFREIAELSNVSVKAIEKLMHKALIKLRTQINNIP
jgi:RNA polymerase sigma-70 factor (ECF subfamily)